MHIRISTQKKQAILPVELGTTRLGKIRRLGATRLGKTGKKKMVFEYFLLFPCLKVKFLQLLAPFSHCQRDKLCLLYKAWFSTMGF
jgi:hypothetical protein